MALLHQLHDDVGGFARQNTFWIQKAARRIGAAFRTFHQAIVKAKLGRLRTEMLLRPDYDERFASEHDASKFSQWPLILSDKWDF